MKFVSSVHNIGGGGILNYNQIKINETVYEVHRVYSSESTVADIIKGRLCETHGKISPLTGVQASVYNNDSEDGKSKEYK